MLTDFVTSESMGPNAHFWRLQPWRRGLLHDLLLPLPSADAQATKVRRSVSVRASHCESYLPFCPLLGPLCLTLSADTPDPPPSGSNLLAVPSHLPYP